LAASPPNSSAPSTSSATRVSTPEVGLAIESENFFGKSGAVDEPTIQSETDRYISWPAQALSYKLGQINIRKLRTRAQKELAVISHSLAEAE
jgi:hypothetical protein